MTLVNLVTIGLLAPRAFALLDDYVRQRREGRDPVFTRDLFPDDAGITCWTDAEAVTGRVPLVRAARQRQRHAGRGDHWSHH